MARRSPVIIITGTPGTGKSTHASLLEGESPIPLQHINVGELVKTHSLHQGFDDEWQSYNVDEDKVGSELSYFSVLFTFFAVFTVYLSSSTNSNHLRLRVVSFLIGIRATSSLNAG